jgi:CheY-like chemotaxis protein/anti-sigma regulatory factor (Ser/Thr protein kinase)
MSPSRRTRKRILVVDDDPALRHVLKKLLEKTGYTVSIAKDGVEALEQVDQASPDLVLLDLGLPRLGGMEVLGKLQERTGPVPLVIVMTADNTPETLLRAVREHAFDYIAKPFPPNEVPEMVARALAAPGPQPIEVLSATPEWVELLVPCTLEVAERIQGFMMKLEADLPEPVRDSVGQAFRELLLNGIEWGGKLDPGRRVRISYLRARRMLLYRIADPGEGFSLEGLTHSAISNPAGSPFEHAEVREQKGLRPGGFGLLMVRAMVDELIYNEARNEVVFVKYLD